jgi:DNA-3-methyladenine glycosylase I
MAYHDNEWGRPSDDERHLFEMLMLEGFQAGLSWLTILRKRDAFRAAFDAFDRARVAAFGDDDVERLMGDAAIVRNRAKIEATIGNARAVDELAAEFGTFVGYLHAHVPQPPACLPRTASAGMVPITTQVSDSLSRDLKKRGFRFVGSTIVYSFMQAVGLVDDHVPGCFRYAANGAPA